MDRALVIAAAIGLGGHFLGALPETMDVIDLPDPRSGEQLLDISSPAGNYADTLHECPATDLVT